MRKALFALGWSVLFVLPVIYTIQIVVTQDLPHVAAWQWAIPLGAVALIYLSRNRDDVFKHHVV